MELIFLLLLSLPVLAQPNITEQSDSPSNNALRQSIDKQRASVRKQVLSSVPQANPASTSSAWYSTPWQAASIEPIAMPSLDFTPRPVASPLCAPIAPETVDPLIRAASGRENVQADLIRAVIQQESAFRPCAVSPKGAQGLMQLMPGTASHLGVQDVFDPKQNIDAGAKVLAVLLAKYKGDVKLALSAYNAGTGAVDRAGGVPNIDETRNYLKSILQKLYY